MNAQQYYRSIKRDRESWRDEMPQRCMRCWEKVELGTFRWPEIHEILTRGQAPNNWGFRANYLLLCNPCHLVHDPVQNWTHARQLGLKRLRDPKHYDLQEWLRRRNPRAMTYVTEDEVRRAM